MIRRLETLAFVFAIFLEMKGGEEPWIENLRILKENLGFRAFRFLEIGGISFVEFLIFGRRRIEF